MRGWRVRVLNLLGDAAEAAAWRRFPTPRSCRIPATVCPMTCEAEAMFTAWQPAPIHERLDEMGVQWMHIPGTGVDGWPRELLAGRTVTCARGVSAVPIAEYVLAAMLAFEKGIPRIFLEEKPEHWNFDELGELGRKTVGIVGLGGIGEAVARADAGLRLAGSARCDGVPSRARPTGVELATDFADLLATADHLVIAAPATSARRTHLLDAAAFDVDEAGRAHREHRPRRTDRSGRAASRARRWASGDGHARHRDARATPGRALAVLPTRKVRVTAHISWSSPRRVGPDDDIVRREPRSVRERASHSLASSNPDEGY